MRQPQEVLEHITIATPLGDARLRATLAAEFPSIHVRFDDAAERADVRASEWDRRDFDTWRFDCAVDELTALTIADDRGARASFPVEVLNRCQRRIGRRNRFSHDALYDRVLARHRELHDLSKPLVRADYNHALDVWQWMLRLEPNASVSAQFSALFHDVERLANESEARVEHLAADYQTFKDEHAREGARLTVGVLAMAGVAESVRERVAAIVAAHERQSEDAEVALLNDADALSFFSLNANGYADYFGPEQTKKKVAYTLGRLRPAARTKLQCVHLRDDVRALVAECMTGG